MQESAEKFSAQPRKEWPTAMKYTCYSTYSSWSSVQLEHSFQVFKKIKIK